MIQQFQPQALTCHNGVGPPNHHHHRSFFTAAPPPKSLSFFSNHPDKLPSVTMRRRRRNIASSSSAASPVSSPPPDKDVQRKGTDLPTLARRFWKVAAPYWFSDDKVQGRLQLAAVFALTLGTTGISVGFSFLGRDFYNALANKDQEQFTKQLLYYLGGFAGGIPVSTLLHSLSSLC